MKRCSLRRLPAVVLAALLLGACVPESYRHPVEEPGQGAPPAPAATAILQTPGPGVADILAHPPAPGQAVELDAYFSGASMPPFSVPPPPADQVVCPFQWQAALTDGPFPPALMVLNSTCSNALPQDAPWLVAVTPEMRQPGVRRDPDLPYHARLRGHLRDAAFGHCDDAARVFMVEQVVKVYEQEPPAAPPNALPADFAAWPRYHDAGLGCSLPHPAGWQVEKQGPSGLVLRGPQWPAYPVALQVYEGETLYDQYDPASTPRLLQGSGWGVYEQGLSFGEALPGSQRLAGYQVEREAPAGQRGVAVLLSGNGRTYELSLRYPTGFDAPQPLLTTYSAMVEGFRLDTPPGPSPTPPVRQSLGAGPFLSQEEALAAARRAQGEGIELLGAELVPEAEARRRAAACGTYSGHSEGVWVLTVRGTFEGTGRTMRLFLDATSGQQLCGEEMAPEEG